MGIFPIPVAGRLVRVQSRSEFEARIWAANKTVGLQSLCTLTQWGIHLGPICQACQCCYSHCRCEVARI